MHPQPSPPPSNSHLTTHIFLQLVTTCHNPNPHPTTTSSPPQPTHNTHILVFFHIFLEFLQFFTLHLLVQFLFRHFLQHFFKFFQILRRNFLNLLNYNCKIYATLNTHTHSKIGFLRQNFHSFWYCIPNGIRPEICGNLPFTALWS